MSSNAWLITLVSDNHVDNYLKEILAFVYYGSILNNRPKNSEQSSEFKEKNHELSGYKECMTLGMTWP